MRVPLETSAATSDSVSPTQRMEARASSGLGTPLSHRFNPTAQKKRGDQSRFKSLGSYADVWRSRYVVEPSLSFEHTVHGSRYNRPAWFPNMGLANYIEKDGYFHILYGDTNELGPGNEIINATDGVGSAGNPDQGVAVVRAKISEVVAAAKQVRKHPSFLILPACETDVLPRQARDKNRTQKQN